MMSQHRDFLPRPLRQSDGKDDGSGSFTDPVFDDDYYGRDQAGGRGRTIGLIIGVVAGAVIAGAAAWTVFGPGSNSGAPRTPLIVAEPEPYKMRPDEPGGLQVENQDKLVYGRLSGVTPEPGVESILPPPEAPKAPEPDPVPVPVEPEVVSAPVAAPPLSPEPESVKVELPVVVPPTPVVTAPAVPVEKQTLESMVAALSGDYLIQIAALRSEEAAQGEWDRVSARYPNLLSAYQAKIVRADLGERGIFYRLRAGPLVDRAAAESLCESLAAEKVGCLVVRNE